MPNYKTYVFDLDGVLLDSNASKSQAFYDTALPYGEDAARAMVILHRRAGSISRAERWRRFFAEILQREPEEGELEQVIAASTERILEGVKKAPWLPGVQAYLDRLGAQDCVLVSGIETDELRRICDAQDLTSHFAHIYGGPRHKSQVLRRLAGAGMIEMPAVYYGDTEDDYESAVSAGLDFVFVYGSSEFADWRAFFQGKSVDAISDFNDLLPRPAPLRVRVDRSGHAMVNGEDVFVGSTLAGAEVIFR